MPEFLKKDYFDENEKRIIQKLVETEKLKHETSYCNFHDIEFYRKWSTSQNKMANVFIALGAGGFLFFLFLYFAEGSNAESRMLYIVLFILCFIIIVFWIAVKRIYIRTVESKVYEKKKVACKYYIASNSQGVRWKKYSVAEVLLDGQVKFFGVSERLISDDEKLYENKLLLADMSREKDYLIKMFHINLTNCEIIRTKD